MVSNRGNVKSLNRVITYNNGFTKTIKGRYMKFDVIKNYNRVMLSKENVRHRFFVHRLVAQSFLENNKNLPQVNHKNGIRNDNNVDNLEWCTPSYNSQHSVDTGLTSAVGETCHLSKLTKIEVREIKIKMRDTDIRNIDLAREYNVCKGTISEIRRNKTWKQVII